MAVNVFPCIPDAVSVASRIRGLFERGDRIVCVCGACFYCRRYFIAGGFGRQAREAVGEILYRAFPSISFRVRLLQIPLSLHCFRSALLHFSNGFAVLRILNAKTHLTSHKITYAENQFSTFRNDFSFAVLKSETLRVTRTIPFAIAVAAI